MAACLFSVELNYWTQTPLLQSRTNRRTLLANFDVSCYTQARKLPIRITGTMMIRNSTYQETSFGFQQGITPGIKYLLIANAGVFVLQYLLPAFNLERNFGLVPYAVSHSFAIWQLATCRDCPC